MAFARKNHQDGYEGDWGTPDYIDPSMLEFAPAPEPTDASVDHLGGTGTTIRDKPVFTEEEAAFYLNRGDGLITSGGVTYESGAEWFGGKGPAKNDWYFLAESKADNDGSLDTINFGFYNSFGELPEPYVIRLPNGQVVSAMGQTNGFSPFDDAQKAAAREAIQMWDDLIDLDFVETHSSQADINFMNTTTGPIQASAYLPYDYGTVTYTNGQPVINSDGEVVTYAEISGDVYINPGQATNHQFDEGQYGLTTLIHELGHSLGLEHPGNYNFGPNFTANYVNGAEYYQDSNQYSIMSYWGGEETGAAMVDWSTLSFVYASTPSVHDVLAIQRIYGADMTTRTGDTVYGFNSNAGRDAFDFTKTPLAVVTIWDAGGTDTLDLSGYDSNSTINLNPGQFSSAGGSGVVPLEVLKANGVLPASYTQAQYDALRAKYNSTDGMLHDNIAIAYGAWIENAVGGAGDDLIIANAVKNVIDGGAGFDTVSYEGASAGVTVSWGVSRGTGGDAEGDRYVNIEALSGSNFADRLTGGNGEDIINGLGGDDIIIGGNDDDTLSGGDGDDRLDGGNSSDSLFGGAGNDVLEGGNSSDTLDGGAGNDTLLGGNSSDILNGGAGDDILTGGNSKDVFAFTDAGNDTITDYDKGETIDFSGLGIDAGDVRIEDNTIFADLNGDTVADLTVVVQGDEVLISNIVFG
jgi:serralysin